MAVEKTDMKTRNYTMILLGKLLWEHRGGAANPDLSEGRFPKDSGLEFTYEA